MFAFKTSGLIYRSVIKNKCIKPLQLDVVVFNQIYRTTTILCVRKDGHVVMAGDGQVSQGSTVVKGNIYYITKKEIFINKTR